jgi:putative transposase
MRGPKPAAIELSKAERAELEQLTNTHSTAQQIALRSRIILAADAGQNNAEIARERGVALNTVRLWRERWLRLSAIPLDELSVGERLEDLPRPGAPAGISADQQCQIVALVYEAPVKSGRPLSHWTGREMADELMKRGIVDTISPRHAQRLFKRSGS